MRERLSGMLMLGPKSSRLCRTCLFREYTGDGVVCPVCMIVAETALSQKETIYGGGITYAGITWRKCVHCAGLYRQRGNVKTCSEACRRMAFLAYQKAYTRVGQTPKVAHG